MPSELRFLGAALAAGVPLARWLCASYLVCDGYAEIEFKRKIILTDINLYHSLGFFSLLTRTSGHRVSFEQAKG